MKRKSILIFIGSILTFFFLFNLGNNSNTFANSIEEDKQHEITTLLKKNKVNGIVLYGILSDSPSVVAVKQPKINKDDEVTSTTLYPIASLQKVYTGIAIQRLINEGKLSLNTSISKFYPTIHNATKITIENLLTHRSGIKDKTNGPTTILENQQAQLSYTQRNLISTGKIGIWNYSNSDYALLAGIISKVTGQSYERYLSETLFKPNNLKNIKFYNQIKSCNQITNAKISGTVQNNRLNFEELKTGMSGALGAGEVFCSANDYWRFISGLILGKYIPLSNIINNPYNYYDGVYLGKNIIHADGSINRYQSCFVANYRNKQAFIFFSNNISFEKMLSIREQLQKMCIN